MQKEKTMILLAFACSKSLKENFDYGIYYDPTRRNYGRPFSHIGFYNKQAIVGIGAVSKIAACDLIGGQIIVQPRFDQNVSASEKQRIKNTILKSSYNISIGHKFILVDKVERTHFVKGTSGPLRSKQYIDLSSYPIITSADPLNVIANKLYKLAW